ncbi:Golgi transport complex subunit 3 [Blastocladiella emersonii ATCC 22665]|nr:Golgi transport complex subunit 3 [Blastocladiella emersonii ATCC 22665]
MTSIPDWDRLVPLDDAQVDVFLALEEVAVDPAFVFGLAPTDKNAAQQSQSSADQLLDDMEALALSKVAASPLPESHPLCVHARALVANVDACRALTGQLASTGTLLDTIESRFDSLQATHGVLRDATDRLMRDKGEVERIAREIETHLGHFAFLEDFAQWVNQSPLPLEPAETLAAPLARADECMAFMAANSHFTDAALYHARFRQCMTKAMTAVRNHVVGVVRGLARSPPDLLTAAGVSGSGSGGDVGSTSPKLDLQSILPSPSASSPAQQHRGADAVVSLMAVVQTAPWALTFRAACTAAGPIMRELTSRCVDHPEYHALRAECVNAYLTTRHQIVGPIVDALVHCLEVGMTDVVEQLSVGLPCLASLIDDEFALFDVLFSSAHRADAQPLIDFLVRPVDAFFRPRVAAETDLAVLAELSHTLAAAQGNNSGSDQHPLLADLLAEARRHLLERIQSQLAHTFGGPEVQRYHPSMLDSTAALLRYASHGLPAVLVQRLAHSAVLTELLPRLQSLSQSIPAPATLVAAAGQGKLSIQTASSPAVLSGDAAGLLDLQLSRVRELFRLATAVDEIPGIDAYITPHERLLANARADSVASSSSSSLLDSVLSLATGSSPASAPTRDADVDIRAAVHAALIRARDELVLDRVHATTQPLKRWLVRAAALGPNLIVDPAAAPWAALDATIRVAAEWRESTEPALRETAARIDAYLNDLPAAARAGVAVPVVDGIARVYRDYYVQVARIHGTAEAGMWEAAVMAPDACLAWLRQLVRA